MIGGGELIASFLDAGEIDEFDMARRAAASGHNAAPAFIQEVCRRSGSPALRDRAIARCCQRALRIEHSPLGKRDLQAATSA